MYKVSLEKLEVSKLLVEPIPKRQNIKKLPQKH
jgi:hypothetical protein